RLRPLAPPPGGAAVPPEPGSRGVKRARPPAVESRMAAAPTGSGGAAADLSSGSGTAGREPLRQSRGERMSPPAETALYEPWKVQ
ncbi:MAG: hypothetical protein QJR01_05240, partial [Kyrpidia sp.]|nr:hypothetical protein [Kyrpidia sp.]